MKLLISRCLFQFRTKITRKHSCKIKIKKFTLRLLLKRQENMLKIKWKNLKNKYKSKIIFITIIMIIIIIPHLGGKHG